MRIIVVIANPSAIQRILRYFGEPTAPPRTTPARGPPLWEAANAGYDSDADPLLQHARAVAFGQCLSWTNSTLTNGCALSPGGGGWNCTSARATKRDVAPVDSAAILARLAELPIATWPYADEAGGARHLGPMAEDFRAAFGLGDGDHGINSVDTDGVALAAIQGLNAKPEAKVAEQAQEIAELERAVEALMSRTSLEGRAARAR